MTIRLGMTSFAGFIEISRRRDDRTVCGRGNGTEAGKGEELLN